MRDYISASYVSQVAMCPASGRLPRRQTTNEAAERGTLIHRWIAHNIEPLPGGFAMPSQEAQDELTQIDLVTLLEAAGGPALLQSEQAFIYNPRTRSTKHLGRLLNREYGKVGAGLVPMTIDIMAVDALGRVTITDVKTGKKTAAKDSWQLKVNALAMNVGAVKCQLAFLESDGSWTFDVVEYTAEDLTWINEELLGILLAVKKGAPTPSEEACRWCPCYASCPATVGLIKAMVKSDASTEITAEAGKAWQLVQSYKKVIEAAEGQLIELARRSPFQLDDGRWVKEITQEREYANDNALDALAALVGSSLALQAATTNKKAIERVSRMGGFAPSKVIDEMRAMGAFEMKTTTCVKAVKQ